MKYSLLQTRKSNPNRITLSILLTLATFACASPRGSEHHPNVTKNAGVVRDNRTVRSLHTHTNGSSEHKDHKINHPDNENSDDGEETDTDDEPQENQEPKKETAEAPIELETHPTQPHDHDEVWFTAIRELFQKWGYKPDEIPKPVGSADSSKIKLPSSPEFGLILKGLIEKVPPRPEEFLQSILTANGIEKDDKGKHGESSGVNQEKLDEILESIHEMFPDHTHSTPVGSNPEETEADQKLDEILESIRSIHPLNETSETETEPENPQEGESGDNSKSESEDTKDVEQEHKAAHPHHEPHHHEQTKHTFIHICEDPEIGECSAKQQDNAHASEVDIHPDIGIIPAEIESELQAETAERILEKDKVKLNDLIAEIRQEGSGSGSGEGEGEPSQTQEKKLHLIEEIIKDVEEIADKSVREIKTHPCHHDEHHGEVHGEHHRKFDEEQTLIAKELAKHDPNPIDETSAFDRVNVHESQAQAHHPGHQKEMNLDDSEANHKHSKHNQHPADSKSAAHSTHEDVNHNHRSKQNHHHQLPASSNDDYRDPAFYDLFELLPPAKSHYKSNKELHDQQHHHKDMEANEHVHNAHAHSHASPDSLKNSDQNQQNQVISPEDLESVAEDIRRSHEDRQNRHQARPKENTELQSIIQQELDGEDRRRQQLTDSNEAIQRQLQQQHQNDPESKNHQTHGHHSHSVSVDPKYFKSPAESDESRQKEVAEIMKEIDEFGKNEDIKLSLEDQQHKQESILEIVSGLHKLDKSSAHSAHSDLDHSQKVAEILSRVQEESNAELQHQLEREHGIDHHKLSQQALDVINANNQKELNNHAHLISIPIINHHDHDVPSSSGEGTLRSRYNRIESGNRRKLRAERLFKKSKILL